MIPLLTKDDFTKRQSQTHLRDRGQQSTIYHEVKDILAQLGFDVSHVSIQAVRHVLAEAQGNNHSAFLTEHLLRDQISLRQRRGKADQ